MRALGSILLLCLLVLAGCPGAAPETETDADRRTPDPADPPIRIELDTNEFLPNRHSVIVRFRNVSDRTVTVLRPVDGSMWGWHMPTYRFTVVDEAGNPLELLGRCGLSGIWEGTDWPDWYRVYLPPDATFTLAMHLPFEIEDGKAYTVALEYIVAADATRGPLLNNPSLVIPDDAWVGAVRSEPLRVRWEERSRDWYEQQATLFANLSRQHSAGQTPRQIAETRRRRDALLEEVFGAPIRMRDQDALERAQVFMLCWQRRGMGWEASELVDALSKVMGKPTSTEPGEVRYVFEHGIGWRFLMEDGVMTDIEEIWP